MAEAVTIVTDKKSAKVAPELTGAWAAPPASAPASMPAAVVATATPDLVVQGISEIEEAGL